MKMHGSRLIASAMVITVLIGCLSMGALAEDTQTTPPEPPSGQQGGTPPEGTPPDGQPPKGGMQLEEKTSSTYFSDLTSDYSWAIAQIDYLYEKGIVKGTGDGVYSPTNTICRGDFVLMLYRNFSFEGTPEVNYTDVAEDIYYYEAVSKAKAAGITDNTSTFAPADVITRQDAILMLYRALKTAGKITDEQVSTDVSQYSDASLIAAANTEAVATLSALSIIQGTDGAFLPENTLTRAEMAVVFYRAVSIGQTPQAPPSGTAPGEKPEETTETTES